MDKVKKFTIHLALIFGAILMILPFLWMLSTSFKLENEIFINPPIWISERFAVFWNLIKTGAKSLSDSIKYLFQNYILAWNAQPFARYFFVSTVVAVTTTVLQLFFSSMAAFAFTFLEFPFKNALFVIMFITMMFPPQVLLIPNYATLYKLGWIDTFFALIVPWSATIYSIFFFRQFFKSIPKDFYDAAKIDGCSNFTFYWKILIPMSLPPFITMGIFTFVANWNSFLWPLIVTNSTEMRTIQVGLATFAQAEGTQWALLMAASTFSILPLVIGYMFAQKYFISSLTRTGLKG